MFNKQQACCTGNVMEWRDRKTGLEKLELLFIPLILTYHPIF